MRINLDTNNSVISTNSINSNLSQERELISNKKEAEIQEAAGACDQVAGGAQEGGLHEESVLR